MRQQFAVVGELAARGSDLVVLPELWASGYDAANFAGDTVTVIDTPDFGKVGIATCFDADHAGYARSMRARGARLVLMPTAYELGAERWWDVLHSANALAGQWWIMVNQSGGAGQAAMFGRSRVLDPSGRTVHEAPRHDCGATNQLTTCTIDFLEGLRMADASNAALWEGARPAIY